MKQYYYPNNHLKYSMNLYLLYQQFVPTDIFHFIPMVAQKQEYQWNS